MGIGGGFYNLEEFLATVEIPFMTAKTYQKHNKIVADRWKQTADEVMRRAAEEEAQHARAIMSIDENDVPLVPVVVDGCWSKRSYNTNYNALSGAAAIIGRHTGKVLFLGVRNKYCVFCARNKDENAKFHMYKKPYWKFHGYGIRHNRGRI
jgi:hypothetical protein